MKLMYPARLGPEMKCPKCKTKLTPIGAGTLVVCANSHVIECVLLVTLKENELALNSDQFIAPSQPKTVSSEEPFLPPKKTQ